MRYRHNQHPISITDVLARWLKRKHLDADLRQYTIWNKWSTLVGDRIAAHTQPQNLKNGVLTVIVGSAAWLNELNFMKGTLLRSINDAMGPGGIMGIRLVAGKLCRRHPAPPLPDKGDDDDECDLPPEYLEALDRELDTIQDPELHEVIRRARLAQLKRRLRYGEP